jgi:hypothetical protein
MDRASHHRDESSYAVNRIFIFERYQRHIYYHRRDDGRALSVRTQQVRLNAIV